MDGDPKFTLFWRTGDRQVIQGRTPAEAMTLAGYSNGALRALDFWNHGDRTNDDSYWFDKSEHRWRHKDIAKAEDG